MPYLLSLRSVSASVLVTAAATFGFSGVAGAAPHDYCGDLKGTNTGKTCEIRLSDTGYSVDVTIPLNYPDQKSIAEYVAKTRDAFVNAAKSGGARSTTAQLSMKPTEYNSDLPPRGTQTVVFKVYQTGGNGQPQTAYKAFNWDQSYRKPVLYTVPKDDKDDAPLWRVDDPLKTVAPIVQAVLQQQLAPPPVATPTPTTTSGQPTTTSTTATSTTPPPPPPPLPFSPATLYDPANYQNFAVLNDGIRFFFDQGAILPDSYGALQVLVPRSAIDPMIA
ncbi:immunogenic protein MPT64 [Mycobacteroides abscessus subsp. massiliense]|uniref:RsiV family protein n=1 Tax=Mycobacteroides abscessus TaxID=36809 RepID=UPI0009A67967|nr:RsiV family protein [Mycobacteroides abscessus]SKY32645.1 immunogenic protein MPT64 [Mycobacteroides abscessus subsp. massiliense]SKY73542.1 immunogenic protein MPT64 [Mycobacteroides abscessus subsp. massiliense]